MNGLPQRRQHPGGFRRLAAAFLVAWAAAAGAQETQSVVVAVSEVVRASVAHSWDLRIAEEQIVAAEAKVTQADAAALPAIDARLQATRYGGLQDVALGSILVIPAIEERYSASVGVTQPLYTGGRIAGQKAGAGHQRAAAFQNRRAAQSALVLQALTIYWDWSKAFYSVESLKGAVNRMEAHAHDMQNLYKAGMATDNDTLATDVLSEQTRLRLMESQRRVELARAGIATLTGTDPAPDALPAKPETGDEFSIPPQESAIAAALQRRPELEASRQEAGARRSLAKASRSDYFPQVYLSARYEQANPNPMMFPPAERWDDDMFAGVTMSWSVLDWGLTRGKAREAESAANQAEMRSRLVEERITLEVRQARIRFQDAVDRLAVARRIEKSAQRNLDSANDLWKGGLARHSDVLDALSQLNDAQFQLVAAQADAIVARAEFDYSQGNLAVPDSAGSASK